ncbi:hypothetical protein [Massilia sp. 9I]|nr:hypothetical protein [Massilia sp. 9I]VXB73268.1 hypothetical protein MASSI9I_50161 [Massilia sp. 9I]
MTRLFAKRAGFRIFKEIEIYAGGEITAPARPEPYGYAINFYPYDSNTKE